MTNMLFSLFAFILTISFLVFIHEYGHFWVARRFGVRIEKFSIGFGKPIVKWYGKRDNTEYSLSWIPLGGYVKMYGETTSALEGDTPQASIDLSRDNGAIDQAAGSFSALPPFKRLLIAFAGPAVNLLFAIFAMWLLLIIGIPAWKPTIGTVAEQSALARAKISTGDTIVNIDGNEVATMTDATIALVDALGQREVSVVTTDSNQRQKTATLDLFTYKAGDEMAINQLAGFTWALDDIGEKLPAIVNQVSPNTPAASAGLQTGDTVIRIDQQPIRYWKDFVVAVRNSPEQSLALTIRRNGQEKPLTLIAGRHPKNPKIGFAGVSPRFDRQAFEVLKTTQRYGVVEAFPQALAANVMQAKLLLKTLGRLIGGKVSVENLGGPISIADYSGQTLSAGYVIYFKFLAVISLILAVMNLLPIPVLDGGHILMCLVEMVRGKPLSERALDILMRLGGSVLLTFMLFVISVDVWRYLFK